MCLITFAYHAHPNYKLVVAANRDELYGRPASLADFWADYPEVLAGRDLEKMGTWMGVTKAGRFAALTNYRDPFSENPNAISRGELVSQFLCGTMDPEIYLQSVKMHAQDYNGFNLIIGDTETLYYFSNREGEIRKLEPGIYGLSNALLDTPWPKVEKSKARLKGCLEGKERIEEDCLFELLADEDKAPKDQLPDTGIDEELEHLLSSPFISSPKYGTRTSTLVTVDTKGHLTFAERTYQPEQNERTYAFDIVAQKEIDIKR
ncbi:hypothetical protein GCM10011391_33120 [Pullulanibacillus camelliae]|uniref:NRDE family protein n=1 Tax=Pullulanibacillus camelliae TaxID=1707096 RepID=A0A8J2YL24_9BACL|nr:NRDE family protein [Pullulanibacillus camelliae]GGE51696.1 hypothetical protein GCM10011391_33120 [Pullulanibacillus camelliae]